MPGVLVHLIPPLAIFGGLHVWEIVLVFGAALMVFGKDLPQVAMRGAAQLVRLKRQLQKMWQEAGLEDELRRVQREVDAQIPKLESPVKTFQRETRRHMQSLDLEGALEGADGDLAHEASGASDASSLEAGQEASPLDPDHDHGDPGQDEFGYGEGTLDREPDPEPAPPATGAGDAFAPRPVASDQVVGSEEFVETELFPEDIRHEALHDDAEEPSGDLEDSRREDEGRETA